MVKIDTGNFYTLSGAVQREALLDYNSRDIRVSNSSAPIVKASNLWRQSNLRYLLLSTLTVGKGHFDRKLR